ncbi:MAG: lysophospholipid acyltransferase family protein [Nocardioides sp.]
MAYPRKLQERRGWAFALCVALLEPLLRVLTRRRWIDGDKVPAHGGCVVAGNHVSHVDPFTFAHFVYGHGRVVRFLAKAEVFDIPVAGRVVHAAGQIRVYRLTTDASLAFGAAVAAVESGCCVVVYPEGTITRQPELWPMVGRTGAARIALTAGVPVTPVAQWGPQDILPPYSRWPRLVPRKTIVVKAGDPVDLDDLREQELTPEVLREATDRIMGAITRELEEIRGERAPVVRFDARVSGLREIGNPNAPDKPRRTRENGDRW